MVKAFSLSFFNVVASIKVVIRVNQIVHSLCKTRKNENESIISRNMLITNNNHFVSPQEPPTHEKKTRNS